MNGGIYIKLGQGFAAVNHVLPKEYVERLSALQVRSLIRMRYKNSSDFSPRFKVYIFDVLIKDKCLTRGKDELEEIFLQDFGKKPEELLREIEPEPVAAASLAQVLKVTYLLHIVFVFSNRAIIAKTRVLLLINFLLIP